MELIDNELKLRPFKESDAKKLALLCNNRKIWDNLRDYIPFPYSEQNAKDFIELCKNENPQFTFAIGLTEILSVVSGLLNKLMFIN